MGFASTPQFRDIGDRIPLTWTAGQYMAAGAKKATLHSYGIGASAGAGAETVSLKENGGSTVVVSSAGTETTAAHWVATINGTVGLGDPAFVDAANKLAIGGSVSIEVTAYGGSGGAAAAFARIGLPLFKRGTDLGALETVRVDPALTSQLLSAPVSVPRGANRVTLKVGSTAFSATPYDIPFVLCGSNGTDGHVPLATASEPVTALTTVCPLPLIQALSGGRRIMAADVLALSNIKTDSLQIGGLLLQYEVPAGFSTIYLWAAGSTGLAGIAPTVPDVPGLYAVAQFGAR